VISLELELSWGPALCEREKKNIWNFKIPILGDYVHWVTVAMLPCERGDQGHIMERFLCMTLSAQVLKNSSSTLHLLGIL
jgi:hypothetical protein